MFIDNLLKDLHKIQDWVMLPPWVLWVIAILFLFIGWLCPIEGPFDYVYDKYAEHPAIHRPHKGIPAPPPKKTQIYEDFNEDGEPEWYQITPMFEIKVEE